MSQRKHKVDRLIQLKYKADITSAFQNAQELRDEIIQQGNKNKRPAGIY
ncbi:MAG: hypothetical protein H3Z53_01190 [archaeon]|nr:hypothetical protein [archaeon]MCP8316849.1 hypothetical protein [archaeon]MCP8321358.1 hypothetical protein [archaeon]